MSALASRGIDRTPMKVLTAILIRGAALPNPVRNLEAGANFDVELKAPDPKAALVRKPVAVAASPIKLINVVATDL